MTLSLDEFLRRFLFHLLPKGFVRIRHFGFLANRRRSTLLPLCFAALGTSPCKTNRKPRHSEIAPSLALPQVWRTDGGRRTTYRRSNPTPFSTSVGHDCGMKPLAHNSQTLHGSPRSAPVRPAPDLIPSSRPAYPTVFHHRFSFHARHNLHLRLRADSPHPQHLSLAPFNLHKARVRRASGFLLTAFSNATPHTFLSALSTHPGVASEKALASSAQNPKSVSPVLGAVLNAAVKICVRASLTPARIDVRDGMRG